MDSEHKIACQFGKILKRRRLELGLSQEDLAARCGLHRTYIGPVERGEKNVTLATALKLANALDLRLSEIFLEIETDANEDTKS